MARVLLIVSGGIAAYKSPNLVRRLRDAGHEVRVVTTPSARAFVTELSLSAVSGAPVRSDLLDASEEGEIGHIELAGWPEAVLVAPATANLLARAAAGMADDLATTILLATTAPVCFAPAMNTHMWRHPATQHNLRVLAGRGARFVGPDQGELACGFVGEGRMMDEPLLVAAIEQALARREPAALSGRRVVVSTGPTRTYLDAVRFVTNASTGKMGMELAAAAARAGAEVCVVAGPCALATPPGVRRVDVVTNEQMESALRAELSGDGVDVLAMVAAVSDLAAAPSAGKADKDAFIAGLGQRVTAAPDILRGLAADFGTRTFCLGFAAQTVEDDADPDAVHRTLVELARGKLRDKGVHAVFVNRVGRPDTGFETDTNAGIYVTPEAAISSGPPAPKTRVAGFIVEQLAAQLAEDA